MPAIAVVDDRKSDRETIERAIESTLATLDEREGWSVVSDEPPTEQTDVLNWLDEHDATALVTDWKLNEGAKSNRVVSYEADALIKEIREKRPDFPIFVVTGYKTQAEAHLADVESILSREDFTKGVKTVVPQMLRAGMRRYDAQRKALAKMDVLAMRVAKGKATKKDKAALHALRGLFHAELPTTLKLDAVVSELEGVMKDAETLRKKLEARLRKTKT